MFTYHLEEWRLIMGYENYWISNYGQVMNILTKKILKPYPDKDGYLRLNLYKQKIKKMYGIHQIVAYTFLKNINNKSCIDHIDRNLNNNSIDNLRFATNGENKLNSIKQFSKTSSSYKGVHLINKGIKRWIARIMINDKRHHLGTFLTEVEAGEAYNKKALSLCKEYAKLNEISY